MKSIIHLSILIVFLFSTWVYGQQIEGIATYKSHQKLDIELDDQVSDDMKEQIMAMMRKQTQKEYILQFTENVSFLGTTTPILAFAGLSVGNKMKELKILSWRVIIVAVCVFIGTFFGSSLIAHLVLKLQGII